MPSDSNFLACVNMSYLFNFCYYLHVQCAFMFEDILKKCGNWCLHFIHGEYGV